MERRAFLTGLLGIGGAAALAGTGIAALTSTAVAAPAARPIDLSKTVAPAAPGARTPDGTEVEQAQVVVRIGPRRRYWRRRYYVRPRYRRRYWRRY